MPTIETVEGPDDAGVSDEIKFLEEKYVGNDLIYFQLFPWRRKNPDWIRHKTFLTFVKLYFFSTIEGQYEVDIKKLLLAPAEYR